MGMHFGPRRGIIIGDENTITLGTGGGSVVPPEIQTMSLDFAADAYSTPSGMVSDAVSAGLLTVTRPSPIVVPAASGVFQTFPAGVLPRNDLGLWRRGKTRTNYIRNSSMVGAVVGTPGTLPTGASPIAWGVNSAAPSGITVSVAAAGSADPDLGLPYIDVHFSGTAAANGAYGLQFGGASQIAATAGDIFALSMWLALIAGSLSIDGVSSAVLQMIYTGSSGQALGGVATTYSSDRLMNRDAKPRRLKHLALAQTGNATPVGLVKPILYVTFKSGSTYDFTVRVIAPQVEKVAALTDDASLPILTTNAAVTAQADTYALSGDALALIQGGSGAIEMTTTHLRSSGLDFRDEQSLLSFGGTKVLKRTSDGRIASDLPGSPQTYKSWRSQYGWTQKHAISWTPSGVRVASTSPRHASSVMSGAQPSITTATLDYDGCLSRLDMQDAALSSVASYQQIVADVAIYGATSGGLAAAARARADGKSAVVLGGWREVQPGGMATGGLGAVDASVTVLGDAFGGLSLDYAHWCNEYALKSSLDSKSIDPNVALRYFDWLIRQHQINQVWSKGVSGVTKSATRITGFSCVLGQQVSAKAYIDASYEGDLMAAAGVSYFVGREAADADNPWNGNRGSQAYTSGSAGVSEHQFAAWGASLPAGILSIDPYVEAGNPASGLLPGVQDGGAGTIDASDGALQAYNFRQTMTTVDTGRYPVVIAGSPPAGYDPARYELLGRYLAALTAAGQTPVSYLTIPGTNQYSLGLFVILNQIGSIYDLNATNGFSSDAFGANWGAPFQALMSANGIATPSENYAVATYEEREIYWKWHEQFIRGFWYFLAYSGDSRIPSQISSDAALFGLSLAHYLDPHENDEIHWMTQIYVREARRMVGEMVMEATDISATDGTAPRSLNVIAAGSYSIDSHHVRRYVDPSGRTINEGNLFMVQSGNKTFPIAAEFVLPQQSECSNLFVTFAASARHTGFGALRMEMAHMAMSDAAAIMAGQIVAQPVQPDAQDWVSGHYTSDIRPALLAAGCVAPLTN